MRDLVVSVKRGLNLRKSPVIADNNIIGTLVYGRHFYAETLRRTKYGLPIYETGGAAYPTRGHICLTAKF